RSAGDGGGGWRGWRLVRSERVAPSRQANPRALCDFESRQSSKFRGLRRNFYSTEQGIFTKEQGNLYAENGEIETGMVESDFPDDVFGTDTDLLLAARLSARSVE